MRLDVFDNKNKTSNALKIFFADLVCFLVVTIASIGFCFSYFSDRADVSGATSTARVSIDYRKDANTTLSNVYAKLNSANADELDNIKISPGDKLTLQGYAVNTSTVDVYLLGKLEVINKDTEGNVIDTETIWFNIEDNNELYVERGLFQVGASQLSVGESQALSYVYTFEGERYTNDYATIEINLSVCSHQKDFLDVSSDYTAANGYTAESIYVSHLVTGRYRDVFDPDTDTTVTGLTIEELKKDSSGAYLINSCKDWFIVRSTSSSTNTYHEGKTFKLNAYLDFNKNTTSKTIARLDADLDGQGYTISNWREESGLIVKAYGDISNLGVDGAYISSTTLTGYTHFGVIANIYYTSTMSNCFVIGASQYDATITYDIDLNLTGGNDFRIGGLVGNLSGDNVNNYVTATIENCYAMLNISATGAGTGVYLGGLVGDGYPPYNVIKNCYYYGNIYQSISSGFTGLISGDTVSGSVYNCFAISSSFVGLSNSTIVGVGSNLDNLAYINNTGLASTDADYNKVVKVGNNQTDKDLTLSTFKSSGAVRDAFGWDTNIWSTDIYTGNSGFVVLRAFYTY